MWLCCPGSRPENELWLSDSHDTLHCSHLHSSGGSNILQSISVANYCFLLASSAMLAGSLQVQVEPRCFPFPIPTCLHLGGWRVGGSSSIRPALPLLLADVSSLYRGQKGHLYVPLLPYSLVCRDNLVFSFSGGEERSVLSSGMIWREH